MAEVLVGIACVAVGLLLALRGSLVLRLLIAMWSGLAGFFLGAGVVAAATGETFLADAAALLVGLLVGIVFAAVAYAFYAVALILAMMAFGFTLGVNLMVALGISWTWLVVLGGAIAGLGLAAIAVLGDLPMAFLVILSALAGASVVVSGAMLIVGTIDLADFSESVTTRGVDDGWWYALYLVVAVVGAVVQARLIGSLRLPVREDWHGHGRARH